MLLLIDRSVTLRAHQEKGDLFLRLAAIEQA